MQIKNATIAVTGASGLLGPYIVRALLERGARVIALLRDPSKGSALQKRGVILRQADLCDKNSLRAGFEGAEVVVSNAGLLTWSEKTLDTLMQVNVQGVKNVFEAMSEAGVRRAVHISSAVVYQKKKPQHYTESDPLRTPDDVGSHYSYYALSKACGEREAWRCSKERNIALTTLRPSGIYGAFDQKGFMRTFRTLMNLPIAPYPTHLFIPNVYAGDVAEAVCLALENEISVGQAYNLASAPGERSFWDHYRAWREIGGKSARMLLPLPVPLRYAYDIERAQRELGWRNRSLQNGFSDLLQVEQTWA
jgi:nucleoside-diphosphate-sugar epimerase